MKASICVLLVAVGMAVAVEESANYDMIIAMIKAGQTPVKAFLASVDAPMNAAVQNFAKFNATCRSDLNSLKRGCKGCAMDMCEDRYSSRNDCEITEFRDERPRDFLQLHEEVCGRRASFSNVDRSSEKFWDVIFPQRFEPMFVKSLVVDMVGGGQVDLASNSGAAFKAPAAAGGGLTGGTSSLMSLIGGGGGAGGLEALLGGLGGGAGGDGAGGLSSLLDGLKGDTGGDSPLGGLSSLLGGFGKRAEAASATTAPTCQQFARDPVNVCSYYLDKGECDAECWFDPDTYYSKSEV